MEMRRSQNTYSLPKLERKKTVKNLYYTVVLHSSVFDANDQLERHTVKQTIAEGFFTEYHIGKKSETNENTIITSRKLYLLFDDMWNLLYRIDLHNIVFFIYNNNQFKFNNSSRIVLPCFFKSNQTIPT